MRNVLSEAGACQGLADARWEHLWNYRLAYSGSFVDATDVSGFGSYEHSIVSQKRPPRLLTLPERATLGTLVISLGDAFEYRATPDKNIIRRKCLS